MSVDEHWEDPELPIEKRYDILSSALWAQQEAYKDLAQAWKAQEERLSLIRPLYEGLYKKRWLRWLYLPLDAELEGETLMRCSTCNQLFMKDGPREFVAHQGHQYSPALDGSWWEGVRVKMGWVK